MRYHLKFINSTVAAAERPEAAVVSLTGSPPQCDEMLLLLLLLHLRH